MASRHEVADYPAPWFGDLPAAKEWLVAYDDESDTLHIHFGVPRSAVSVDFDGLVWLRMLPESGEVVGLEIEDFEQAFLKQHPEFDLFERRYEYEDEPRKPAIQQKVMIAASPSLGAAADSGWSWVPALARSVRDEFDSRQRKRPI
ncbi:MAG: DUF2283 domain-containing protein [Chloroflexota bacterium]|nr:DUF2283 domain-containing protein [Chloroflexota bacterium]